MVITTFIGIQATKMFGDATIPSNNDANPITPST
jgi:hypothetical protein